MLRLTLGLTLIALPLAELALLVKTGQLIGFWATLGLVVGAAVLGALVLSHQSWSVLRRTQAALAQGRPPVAPVLDGVILLLAGALLVMPGFLSDVMAFLLLMPPVRRAVARWGVRRLIRSAQMRADGFGAGVEGGPKSPPAKAGRAQGPVIEGEFERLDETTTGPHRRKDRDPL